MNKERKEWTKEKKKINLGKMILRKMFIKERKCKQERKKERKNE